MFKKVVALVLVYWIFSSALTAYAYERNAATKLGRGFANGTTCWIEVPKQAYLTGKHRDPLSGITYGVVKGACYTIIRAASGVYDVVTFLIPPYDAPIFEPEFVFEEWE